MIPAGSQPFVCCFLPSMNPSTPSPRPKTKIPATMIGTVRSVEPPEPEADPGLAEGLADGVSEAAGSVGLGSGLAEGLADGVSEAGGSVGLLDAAGVGVGVEITIGLGVGVGVGAGATMYVLKS
jgi:hypothetical protein